MSQGDEEMREIGRWKMSQGNEEMREIGR